MTALGDTTVEHFKAIVGENNVLTNAEDLAAFGTDWTKIHEPNPSAIVLPGSTDEVSKVLKYCHEHDIAIVASGGRTGLAGGAVAANGEVVLSLNRMNKIETVDTVGMTVRCEAGVTTQELQEAAADAGLFFPLDLAAKGSCQVGGNIATNAGGVKFIRFGGMREQVLGIEVVLANGEVLDLNTGLRKNNTGYDLKQLFIGSEGTLGIVTRATLKLATKPGDLQLALLATDAFAKVPKILELTNKLGIAVTAFEFFSRVAHEIVLEHSQSKKSPFEELYDTYVLLEVEQGSADVAVMESLFEKIYEAELISDGVLASSSTQFQELWGFRENITESLSAHGHVRKNDISLGVDQLADYIKRLEPLLDSKSNQIQIVLFGHIGDGNLHLNYVAPKSMPFDEFNREASQIEERVFQLLSKFQGSISAEHGIGLLKKKDLHYSRTDDEVEIMRKVKAIFDPKNLMNPGKIFD